MASMTIGRHLACLLLCAATPGWAVAAAVWTGPATTFSKASFADPNDPSGQDRITHLVWITRGDAQGLFNAQTEAAFTALSPADTEWAWDLAGMNTGLVIKASNWAALTFNPWATAHGNQPPLTVGIPGVLHLISEDIYIDIQITDWQQGGGVGQPTGGRFAYQRSTPSPIPALPGVWLPLALASGLLGVWAGLRARFRVPRRARASSPGEVRRGGRAA